MQPLTRLLEAALFAAAHPLTLADLARLAPEASRAELVQAVNELREHYEQGEHGIELLSLADGFQVVTRPRFAEAIAEAQLVQRPRKPSRAALETLAVIAYRQPVSRAEIEEIRGVNVEGMLRSLHERGIIEVVGRAEGLGRPLLYGTTSLFLELVGLGSQDELPRLEELEVALRPPTEQGEFGEP